MANDSVETTKTTDISAITVSASVLSEIMGVGDRRIRQLADEGILIRASKGRYNLKESMKNYILTLKCAIDDGGNPEEKLTLDEIKAQHETVKMHMSQLRLALMQGEVHKSDDVERVMKDMLSSFRARLLNLPPKVAPMLVMRDNADQIRMMITKEVTEALNDLKDYNPKEFYSEEYVDCDDYDFSEMDDADE
jgi:phage terminase Nu1 subunit (DNA packaging protein)